MVKMIPSASCCGEEDCNFWILVSALLIIPCIYLFNHSIPRTDIHVC